MQYTCVISAYIVWKMSHNRHSRRVFFFFFVQNETFCFLILFVFETRPHCVVSLALNLFIFCFWDKVSVYSPRWPGAHCIAQAGLGLLEILPPPPNCWDYAHVAPRLTLNSQCIIPKCKKYKQLANIMSQNVVGKKMQFLSRCKPY